MALVHAPGAGGRRVTRITLHPPETTGQAVSFRWTVEPATPLYRAPGFTLRFPEDLDLSRVPESLWWSIALVCLHSHWPLLRPCTVRLPVTLQPGEGEFWSRLLDAETATLEAHGGPVHPGRGVEIEASGPRLAPLAPLPDTGRCATAFSGGKDSLVQTGLLAEVTRDPVLVTTTSPLPGMSDHLTPRRRQVLAELPARRAVRLVEVCSDYRASWDNDFSRRMGYPVSVNEISDTFLYFAALLAAGVALGATHLFLASEAEVQENVELDGRIVQHPHFMYSGVTQQALQALLTPTGVRYGSLTAPLHSCQVLELLWTRYTDLRDLQYSCWRVGPAQAACSRCSQCLRLAMAVLALGDTPARMGVELARLLTAMRRWAPAPRGAAGRPALPNDLVTLALQGQLVRAIRATPPRRVLSAIVEGRPARLLAPRSWRALLAYARLRRRAAGDAAGDPPGYRPGFLALVDPLLRDRVASIFAEHFEPEDEAGYAGLLGRAEALTRWITEPIRGAPRGGLP